jgi:NAD(P)-dependent dehydrogenase (short-subunit alcohol dehydrogenase family)
MATEKGHPMLDQPTLTALQKDSAGPSGKGDRDGGVPGAGGATAQQGLNSETGALRGEWQVAAVLRADGEASPSRARLLHKVALVTGGTSGIGAKIAEQFVREGAKVMILGRNRDTGASLISRFGGSARFIQGDVTREEDIATAIAESTAWGGRLDVLVNNAGGLAPGGVDTFTADDFTYAINLVLGSVLYGIKHASPVMKAQRWGTVINNSSVAALRTHMGGYLYSVAKAAVTHATRIAGMELGPHGITVNSISPGAVATPLFLGGSRALSHMSPGKLEAMWAKVEGYLRHATPMPRSGTTDDIASAAVFLASDEGHFVNCHDLVVDGGLTAAGRNVFGAVECANPVQ